MARHEVAVEAGSGFAAWIWRPGFGALLEMPSLGRVDEGRQKFCGARRGDHFAGAFGVCFEPMSEPLSETGCAGQNFAAPANLREPEDGARWYAVHTLPRREFGARAQLEAQRFTIFLPRHLKTVRHARRMRTVDAPFFPRYLFVRLNLNRDRWLSINGTFGVSHLIMGGDRPLPVPLGVVEALRARLGAESLAPFDDGLRLGQRAEVMVGPFANLVGTLERFDGAERVRILLDLMGTATPVTLARGAVVPVRG